MTLHRKDMEENRQFMLEFYEQYRGFLFHTAWKYSQTQSDCDDLVQEAMVRLLRNADTLRGLTHNQRCAYIHITVRSVCSDRVKSPRELEQPVPDAEMERLGSSPAAHEDWTDAKWDMEILRERLPERDWRLLEMKYITGFSDREIAAQIGCTAASVRMLLLRVRKRARGLLESGKGGAV